MVDGSETKIQSEPRRKRTVERKYPIGKFKAMAQPDLRTFELIAAKY